MKNNNCFFLAQFQGSVSLYRIRIEWAFSCPSIPLTGQNLFWKTLNPPPQKTNSDSRVFMFDCLAHAAGLVARPGSVRRLLTRLSVEQDWGWRLSAILDIKTPSVRVNFLIKSAPPSSTSRSPPCSWLSDSVWHRNVIKTFKTRTFLVRDRAAARYFLSWILIANI